MINVLRKCVIGAMVREEAEERRIIEPSISTSSEPNSGKNVVIIKNTVISRYNEVSV